MTRELRVTYGDIVIGGTTSPGNTREISDWTINSKRFEEFSITFRFFISQTTEALFVTEIDTIEDAFSKPFQDLTIRQGSTDLYTFSQTSNTGLDARPEIVKREDKGSGRHRMYEVRIMCGLPANTGAELVTGLREHSVSVAYDPSRIRTVSVEGVFTAITTANARSQYDAQISSLESSVFSALSITAANRELIEEPEADNSYNTKTLSFRRVWRELIFSQGGSGLNDTGLVRQVLRIKRRKIAPGDTGTTIRRLATLDVDYNAHLDKNVSTDLRGKYTNIKSWILTQVANTLSGGPIALVDESPEFNYDENIINVSMVVLGGTGGNIIENEVKTEDYIVTGVVLVPVWNGDVLGKYIYNGPMIRQRIITSTWKVLGTGGAGFIVGGGGGAGGGGGGIGLNLGALGIGGVGQGFGIGFGLPGGFSSLGGSAQGLMNAINALNLAEEGGRAGGAGGGGGGGNVGGGGKGGMVLISTRTASTPRNVGLDGYKFDVTEYQRVDVYEFYNAVNRGGGSTRSR